MNYRFHGFLQMKFKCASAKIPQIGWREASFPRRRESHNLLFNLLRIYSLPPWRRIIILNRRFRWFLINYRFYGFYRWNLNAQAQKFHRLAGARWNCTPLPSIALRLYGAKSSPTSSRSAGASRRKLIAKNPSTPAAGIGLTMTVVGRPIRRTDIDLNKRKKKICVKISVKFVSL